MPAAHWLVPLEASFAALEQAEARSTLVGLLEAVVKRGLPEVALKLAASAQWQRFEEEVSGLSKEAELLGLAMRPPFKGEKHPLGCKGAKEGGCEDHEHAPEEVCVK